MVGRWRLQSSQSRRCSNYVWLPSNVVCKSPSRVRLGAHSTRLAAGSPAELKGSRLLAAWCIHPRLDEEAGSHSGVRSGTSRQRRWSGCAVRLCSSQTSTTTGLRHGGLDSGSDLVSAHPGPLLSAVDGEDRSGLSRCAKASRLRTTRTMSSTTARKSGIEHDQLRPALGCRAPMPPTWKAGCGERARFTAGTTNLRHLG